MKKTLILIGNILIIALLLVLIMFHVSREQKRNFSTKTAAFENMTVAMENVATNYLLGEEQVCQSWANHINSNRMTAEEAISFVRSSISSSDVMAHILFEGEQGLTGLSTATQLHNAGNYTVSYRNVANFADGLGKLVKKNHTVNVTRAYTNPINALQSIAFYCPITLKNARTGEPQAALLLRIIPVSAFEKKWVFPTEDYKNAEVSLIDAVGDYIIKGHSFKNSNFYEFYQSYNSASPTAVESLKANIMGPPGIVEINNSADEPSIVAHTRVNSTDDWTIVTMITMKELNKAEMSWTLVRIVAAGLFLLLVFNLVIMLNLNRQMQAAADAADRANHAKTDFLSPM